MQDLQELPALASDADGLLAEEGPTRLRADGAKQDLGRHGARGLQATTAGTPCDVRWKAVAATLALLAAVPLLGQAKGFKQRPSGLGAAVMQKPLLEMCPGQFEVHGYGQVSLVSASWNKAWDPSGTVEVQGDARAVVPHMKGRAYFGDACHEGSYSWSDYSSIQLLGKRMRYTVDLSKAGCGCNAALYLTSMGNQRNVSDCSDYYCDAAKVCGVSCAEIDIQEANKNAWYSTLHVSSDPDGQGKGYGRDRKHWAKGEYGPGGKCIDTDKPFEVQAAFPVSEFGSLAAMDIMLVQPDRPCSLSLQVDEYVLPSGVNGMGELTSALAAGMTPVISYWGEGESMAWMDGAGNGSGPCWEERPQWCGDSVTFTGFSVESLYSEEIVK